MEILNPVSRISYLLQYRGTGFVLGASAVAGKDGVNSGDNAWVTGPTVNEYENDSEAYLYTPEFDFSLLGSYEISFYAKYSFENLWDGFIVEYTIDRGQTWNKLDDEGPYWLV